MYPHQPPMPPYGKRITLLLSFCTILGIILCVAAGTNTIIGGLGAALFAGVMTTALIIDWRGVTSLCGLTDWRLVYGKKKFWLIVAWICLFPLMFCIYLIRVAMHQLSAQATPIAPAPATSSRKVKVGLVIGSLIVCIGLISAFGSASGATANPSAPVVTSTQVNTSSLSQDDSTQVPTIVPTDTPTPVPTPTLKPTPKPKPTPPPSSVGINGNPWGYNFQPGNFIYDPPSAFCEYFSCITSFWKGSGYVIECQDDMYSKSGGRSGSCSHHGGNLRPLYSH